MMIIDAKAIPAWRREVFEDMRAGGLDAVNIICSIWEDFEGSMRRVARLLALIDQNSDILYLARTADDIRNGRGRTGIIMSWQNSSGFNDHLPFVRLASEVGLRIVQPAFLTANSAACGCNESADRGLSDFGHDLLAELNRNAIAVDISHLGTRSSRDVIAASKSPVFYAQANPLALRESPRNKPDEDLKAVADKGGVISIASLPPFLGRGEDSTVEDLAASIAYVVDLVGEESVAIGTDLTQAQPRKFYEYTSRDKGHGRRLTHFTKPPILPGLETFRGYPKLIDALEAKGMRGTCIERVMGGNLLRYFTDVWGA